MTRLSSARTVLRLLRAGNLRARVRVTRDGQAAVRLNLGAAALRTGVLDTLAGGAAGTSDLARRLGMPEADLLAAFLRVLAAAGLVRDDAGRWSLTADGRAVVDDDLVRASHEALAGVHAGLYRELGPLLAGGPRRRDVVEQGGVIARVSAAFEPFVDDVLRETVAAVAPRRVLDVVCGAGLQLATMLAAAPGAEGVGIDTDADAAALAGRTLTGRGLTGRARVMHADVRDLAGGGLGQFDLALLANVVYYVPVAERVALLRSLAELLAPGGTLLVVTTVATPQLTSRHFDLLLRAQEGAMQPALRPAAPRAGGGDAAARRRRAGRAAPQGGARAGRAPVHRTRHSAGRRVRRPPRVSRAGREPPRARPIGSHDALSAPAVPSQLDGADDHQDGADEAEHADADDDARGAVVGRGQPADALVLHRVRAARIPRGQLPAGQQQAVAEDDGDDPTSSSVTMHRPATDLRWRAP